MKELNVLINGMSCNHCVMAVKKELSKLKLESAEVEIGKTKVTYSEDKATPKQIKDAIEEAGFSVVE